MMLHVGLLLYLQLQIAHPSQIGTQMNVWHDKNDINLLEWYFQHQKMPQSSINKSYRYSRRYFQDENHYSSPFRSSKISVVLALSANDDDNDSSLSNDAIVRTRRRQWWLWLRHCAEEAQTRRDFACLSCIHNV